MRMISGVSPEPLPKGLATCPQLRIRHVDRQPLIVGSTTRCRSSWPQCSRTDLCSARLGGARLRRRTAEWWGAYAVAGGDPEFLGAQGDPWDTQWDMFMT
jgi:hypothetical protein